MDKPRDTIGSYKYWFWKKMSSNGNGYFYLIISFINNTYIQTKKHKLIDDVSRVLFRRIRVCVLNNYDMSFPPINILVNSVIGNKVKFYY